MRVWVIGGNRESVTRSSLTVFAPYSDELTATAITIGKLIEIMAIVVAGA